MRVERRASAVWITLDRPHVLNALDPDTASRFRNAVEQADRDPEVRAIVITGAGGRAFSVGADLKWRAAHPEAARSLPIGGGLHVPGLDGFLCLAPLVAAVDGFALGGGFELVLACDFAIATDRSVFGLPEAGLGLVADAGGVHRLARQVPWKVAMDISIGGRRLSAFEAKAHGIINEVVEPERLQAAVGELVARIAAASPLAVRATKETALIGLDGSLRDVMNRRAPLHEHLVASADAQEGARAFAAKRRATWIEGQELKDALDHVRR